MIEIKDLSYTIGKKEILKNISFTVNKGSMTCIVGPNGCGKSTLLAHISRRFPSRNSIYYKGHAVETIPRKEYAKEVAGGGEEGVGAGIWDGRRSEGRGCGSYGAVSV